MPTSPRPARVLATACLAVAALLAALPGPAAALEPPRPLPDYRPAFVTETDSRPWTDCLWASAAMMLDKWTNGEVTVTRQALRAASGDRVGGSSFDDLRIALAKHDFDLRFSPDGGAKISWGQLLSRLERGAGAVLLGDYSALPRYYGRWDYAFWKKTGADDNHAVYIDRYDRRRGRVWLMDPLGRDGYQGEWISTRALRAFAWSQGGAVYAAVTPTAKAAPFAGVKASRPKVVLSSTAVDASWSLKAPAKWRFPGGQVVTEFTTPEDALRVAAESPALPVKRIPTDTPERASATVHGRALHVVAPLPPDPGAYVASLALRDTRFGDTFVRSERVAVFVPGDRRATLRLNVRVKGVEAGSALEVSVNAANTGIETWADTRASVAGGSEATVVRTTRLVARWIALDVDPGEAGGTAARADGTRDTAGPGSPATTGLGMESGGTEDGGGDAATTAEGLEPGPVVLSLVPLAPGQLVVANQSVLVPAMPGRWALVIDVVDDVHGSFAALGSAPAVALIDVVAARGIQAVE